MIKTIPMWKMVMEIKGKIIGFFLLAAIPAFIAGSAWMFVETLKKGQIRHAMVGFIAVVFFGACSVVLAPSKKYVPGKTFKFYRDKRFCSKKYINYAYAITVLIFAVCASVSPEDALKSIGYGSTALYAVYIYSKSARFHADVDFSTNEYLTTALGFSAGEKVLISYQNFDAEEVKAGSNAFAATATKFILASFDGEAWTKLSKDLNQVSGIGIVGKDGQSYAMKLEFNDGVDALFYIGLYDKLTSNPFMVIRGLLDAIDASLLSDQDAPQTTKRRRVVVNSNSSASTSENVSADATLAAGAPVRNIEVAPEVLNAIQNAEVTVSGRRLEL
ncbi:hypothetical protein [Pseudomonas sp. 3-2]|uniref:hypothetical protein n=1 Tax=Pseudomonas sp. 3-2 TaxID=2867408 RepID=UPI001C88CC67|nr:hypothetical protein [Pseudomonas sp. 3-2]QZD73790.1 hypothetical protein K3819_13345 [Pseudomonas sp. 3-2]